MDCKQSETTIQTKNEESTSSMCYIQGVMCFLTNIHRQSGMQHRIVMGRT